MSNEIVPALRSLLDTCIREYNAGKPCISVHEYDVLCGILQRLDPGAIELLYDRRWEIEND